LSDDSETDDLRLTKFDEQIGSRYYIPPELENGRLDTISERSDSYTLGKILYFLLTGKQFARESHENLANLLNNPQLNYITERILSKTVIMDVESRLTTIQIIDEAKEIRRLISGGFYPGKVDSICRFCGEGIYKPSHYAGLKSYINVQDSPNQTHPADQYMNCEIISCNNCGHLQFFFKRFQRAER